MMKYILYLIDDFKIEFDETVKIGAFSFKKGINYTFENFITEKLFKSKNDSILFKTSKDTYYIEPKKVICYKILED